MNPVRGRILRISADSPANRASNGMKGLSLRQIIKLCLLAAVSAALFAAPTYADTIARSFYAKGNVEPGRVVALSVSDNTTVELAPADDPNRIYGVAIEQKAAPATVEQPGRTVFVATGGVYPVLASTENGAIKTGDYLSMSSSDGVAAKVTSRQTFIIGRSSENFDGSTDVIGTGNRGAKIGKINAEIIPGRNPQLRESTAVPLPLRLFVESIAGKPLSAARIYSALLIFIITAAIAFGLLWVGVRSGMISIGRNPLSKHLIMQNLAQVIVAATVVFAGGLFGIYLLLRI